MAGCAVLGTLLPSVFVAKGDIEKWPVMGLISHIGRTIFVSRQRSTTGRERDQMIQRMVNGDNLVLFPEGTSSDGSRVLPFMSAFFAIAKLPKLKDGMDKSLLPVTYEPGMVPLYSLSPLFMTSWRACRSAGSAALFSHGTGIWIWVRMSGSFCSGSARA